MQELSANTQKTYGSYIKKFRAFLDGREPSLELAVAFLDGMKEGGAARNTIGVAGRAIRNEFSIQVPVPTIEMSEPRYLTLDQVKHLINKSPTLLEKTLITVLFSSACRISEILNLTMDDLELDKGVATVTRKGGRRERIALGGEGKEALRTWLAARKSRSKRVFMDYTYGDMYIRLKKLARKAGIPEFTAHRLRHSRIRHLLDGGITIEAVGEVAGHSKLDTTRLLYGRLRAEDRARYLLGF